MKLAAFIKTLFFAATVSFMLTACDMGKELPNVAPTTRIFVDKIVVDSSNMLSTTVQLFWSGTDRDGFVTGYEISFDNTTWVFTNRTDTLIKFVITEPSGIQNFDFFVRAIDNDGLRDPEPKYLKLPVRNNAPVAKLIKNSLPADSVFHVLAIPYNVSDVDGNETLRQTFIKINNGDWYPIAPNYDFVVVVADNSYNSGPATGTVYVGPELLKLSQPINGLTIGGGNIIQIKVEDNSNAQSVVDSSKAIVLKQQISDLLLVNGHSQTQSQFGIPAPADVFFSMINEVYPKSFDVFNLIKTSEQPKFWSVTLDLLFPKYNKIFWYGNSAAIYNSVGDPNAERQQMLFEAAASSLIKYQNVGGKLLLSSDLPDNLNPESPLYQLTPFKGLSTFNRSSAPARFASIYPEDGIAPTVSGYDSLFLLESAIELTGADPFYVANSDSLNVIFKASKLIPANGWQGPNNLAVKQVFSNGKTNLVFFSLELHKLNQRPAALKKFFDKVLNDEFNW